MKILKHFLTEYPPNKRINMIQLTKREEEVMLILWKSSNLTVNEILSYTKEANRRHYNTVSTILKILEDKKVIGHFDQGGVFRYFPNVFFMNTGNL